MLSEEQWDDPWALIEAVRLSLNSAPYGDIRQDALTALARLGQFFGLDRLGQDPALVMAVPRNPKFASHERAFLAGKECSACGATELLTAHHIFPVHEFPDLEMVEEHWEPLCRTPSHNCHYVFGHLLDWRAWNPSVRDDARAYREKMRGRSYSENRR